MSIDREPQRPAPASLLQRIAATTVAGVLIVLLLPLLIRWLSGLMDRGLGLRVMYNTSATGIIGLLIAVVGGVFALWPILLQLLQAQGSPIPSLPTQRLLRSGPFRFSRNPMALGTIILYIGLAIWFNSWSALILVLFLSAVLLAYIKRVEEPELEERFGEAYRQFRRETPFLVPRPWRQPHAWKLESTRETNSNELQ